MAQTRIVYADPPPRPIKEIEVEITGGLITIAPGDISILRIRGSKSLGMQEMLHWCVSRDDLKELEDALRLIRLYGVG